MGQVDQALIDRIFSATQLLNRESMQYFVEQLIQARGGVGVGAGDGDGVLVVTPAMVIER